jgi:hypothetical protein
MIETDPRTAQDPESAMKHSPTAQQHPLNQSLGSCDWPHEGASEGGQKPGVDGFDTDAHRAFMRGLG